MVRSKGKQKKSMVQGSRKATKKVVRKKRSKILDADARSKKLYPHGPKTFVLAPPELYLSNQKRLQNQTKEVPAEKKSTLRLFINILLGKKD